jgi:hypothetical protein
LDQASCEVLCESWPLSRLFGLTRRHLVSAPRAEHTEIIVLAYRGTYFLLDGNNRLNKWAGEDRRGDHQVLIVKLKSS